MKRFALIAACLAAPVLAQAQDDNMGTFSSSTSSSGSSHSESSSSSSSSSVTFGTSSGSIAPQLGTSGPPPGWPGHHDADPAKSVAGKWTLGATGSSDSCSATLYDDKASDGLHGAWLATGCPEGFFKVTRWRSDGRTLDLADVFGTIYGSFHRTGRNRFEGQTSSGGAVFLTR